MKTLVIDDEVLARSRVINLLTSIPEIEIIGECSTGKEAIRDINSLKPQLIFLDINMKDMNGFGVLEHIRISPKPIVIFVTAYDHYASQAFDVEAFDFLLKPFKDERFFRTVEKVLRLSQDEADKNFEKKINDLLKYYSAQGEKKNNPIRIPIKTGNKTILLDPSTIRYIIASGCYAEIFAGEKKMVIRESLNNLEGFLNPKSFVRIHRSTIINIDHLKEIVHSDFSEIDAKMDDDRLLHVSKSNKKYFLKLLGL